MPISANDFTYPFDPTGSAPTNKVENEVHIITPVNYRDYNFIIPKFAPFFAEGLDFIYTDVQGNEVPLIEGTDYYLSHHFVAGSRACAKQLYGSISLLNRNLSGVIKLKKYQTVGGMWTYDEAYLLELLTNIQVNPRIASWDSIVTLPASFPVIDHEWDLIDMVGMERVALMLQAIADSIADPTSGGGGVASVLSAHIVDYTNPHRTSKTQVGLPLVENYAPATQEEAEAGASNSVYMTALRVKQAVLAIANTVIQAHMDDHENPHATTAAQILAFTKTEITQLLLGKLDAEAQAADSALFDGMNLLQLSDIILQGKALSAGDADSLEGHTYAELLQSITDAVAAAVEQATQTSVENADKVGGYTALELFAAIPTNADVAKQVGYSKVTPIPAATESWTHLFSFNTPAAGNTTVKEDVQVMLTGGNDVDNTAAALFYIHASYRDGAVSVRNVNGVASSMVFGKVDHATMVNGSPVHEMQIWAKSSVDRRAVSITELTSGIATYPDVTEADVNGVMVPANVVFAEPAGIAYVTENNTVQDSSLLGGQAPAYYATEAEMTAATTRITALENNLITLQGQIDTLLTQMATVLGT